MRDWGGEESLLGGGGHESSFGGCGVLKRMTIP